MDAVNGNRVATRDEFADLEWEMSERDIARRSGRFSHQPVNLSSQIESILVRDDFN